MMNAGSSDVGQAFALRNCDAFFVATAGSRKSLAGNAAKVERGQGAAQPLGREIEVFTVGQVICRPTQQEADDYYQHAIIDNADWGAIDGMLANKSITPQTMRPEEYEKKRRYFASNAVGGYPFVGTPDKVADELATISQAGIRGIGLSFVNYLDEVPYFCAEVLPPTRARRRAREALTRALNPSAPVTPGMTRRSAVSIGPILPARRSSLIRFCSLARETLLVGSK